MISAANVEANRASCGPEVNPRAVNCEGVISPPCGGAIALFTLRTSKLKSLSALIACIAILALPRADKSLFCPALSAAAITLSSLLAY